MGQQRRLLSTVLLLLCVIHSAGVAEGKVKSSEGQPRRQQLGSTTRRKGATRETHRLHGKEHSAGGSSVSRLTDIRRHSASRRQSGNPMPRHTSYVAATLKTDQIDWPKSCEGVQLRYNTTPEIADLMHVALNEAKECFVVTRANVETAWVPLRNGILRAPNQLLPRDASDVIKEEKHKRCAVVGNSGHLLASEYGGIIDSFDAVIRLNQAPTLGYRPHVGSKTTFRLLNRAWYRKYVVAAAKRLGIPNPWRSNNRAKVDELQHITAEGSSEEEDQLENGQRRRLTDGARAITSAPENEHVIQPAADRVSAAVRKNNTLPYLKDMLLPLEEGAILLPMVETVSRGYEMELLNLIIQMARPDARVRVLSLRAVHIAADLLIRWRQRMRCAGIRTSGGFRPTTGFLATFLMLTTCEKLVLYGFGGASTPGLETPFHFYTGLQERTWATKSDNVHSFDAEWAALRALEHAGRLKFCHDASPKDCGSVWDMLSTTL